MSIHDHDLDDQENGNASIVDEVYVRGYNKYICGVSISSHNEDGNEDIVELSPAQALSLLDWLTQEKAFLEQLVKEEQQSWPKH